MSPHPPNTTCRAVWDDLVGMSTPPPMHKEKLHQSQECQRKVLTKKLAPRKNMKALVGWGVRPFPPNTHRVLGILEQPSPPVVVLKHKKCGGYDQVFRVEIPIWVKPTKLKPAPCFGSTPTFDLSIGFHPEKQPTRRGPTFHQHFEKLDPNSEKLKKKKRKFAQMRIGI